MSRLYIFLLGGAALLISSVGALFSIFGLTSLFAGAPISVGVMAGSLEVAKLVVAGFLYRYWGHVNRAMRIYLSAAVVALSIITSLGVFGYLSHAYQKSSALMKTQELQIAQLEFRRSEIQRQIEQVEKFISEVPASRISKKFSLYAESRAQVQGLIERAQAISSEIHTVQSQKLISQGDVGPLIDVADALGVSVDRVAKSLILLFVSVFDPLAICLVFAWGLAIRLREKYRGDEARISALAVSKPVDHRYKKSA